MRESFETKSKNSINIYFFHKKGLNIKTDFLSIDYNLRQLTMKFVTPNSTSRHHEDFLMIIVISSGDMIKRAG